MAQHKDLLQLFRDAHFGWVFIGIESTDPASLRETRKTQNLHEDILTSVRRIYAYGIDVMAGFIIGFDAGNVTLKLRRTSAPSLAICLQGKLDGPFFKRTARGLERLLKDTRASVTLRVDALQAHQFDQFQGLLRRLARYGDRVCTSSLTNACARWCTSTRRCSTWCSRDASTSRRAVHAPRDHASHGRSALWVEPGGSGFSV
jgi:hypothetical protein